MSKFVVDFIGILFVEASDREEAEKKFWDFIKQPDPEICYVEIDSIETVDVEGDK